MIKTLTEILTSRLKLRAMRDRNMQLIDQVISSNHRARMLSKELLIEKQRADEAEKQLNDLKRKSQSAEACHGIGLDISPDPQNVAEHSAHTKAFP